MLKGMWMWLSHWSGNEDIDNKIYLLQLYRNISISFLFSIYYMSSVYLLSLNSMFTPTVPSLPLLSNSDSVILEVVVTVALKWTRNDYYSCRCIMAFIATILVQWA